MHFPSYLPDTLVPLYEQGIAWLVDWLVRLQVIAPSQRTRPGPRASSPGVAAARQAYEKAEQVVEKAKSELASHEAQLRQNTDKFGQHGEFRALDGTCLQKDMGEYTYEFCFGGQTAQISNNDGFRFTLGRFERFDVENRYDASDPQHYASMLYAHGQKCWNGPERSTRVYLACSDTNALLHVFEAEKCTYSMRVTTPAACVPRSTPEVKTEGHDEL